MMTQVLKDLFRSLMKHNIGSLAAVVAFFGFSSLIPILALLVYVAAFLAPHTAVEQFVEGVLRSYFPAIPTGQLFVSHTLHQLVTYKSEVSIIGLVGLLWSTIGGFVTLQQALDTIFEIRSRRSFVLQYVVGFAMMGILLVLTVLTSLASTFSPKLVNRLLHFDPFGSLHLFHLVGQFTFPVVLFITCYACLRVLPSRKLRPFAIFIGAILATILIFSSRVLFAIYTHHLGNYAVMYGTLTFVMLFTYWIYIVCTVFLVSAEVCATIDGLLASLSKTS